MNAMIGNSLLLSPVAYAISRAVRLRSGASASFTRTPASTTNRQTWTWSAWVKRGDLGVGQRLFSAGTVGGNNSSTNLSITSSDTLQITCNTAGGTTATDDFAQASLAVFRDPSAWYHIVCVLNTTNATAANRIALYVNGVSLSVTTVGAYPLNPTLNFLAHINRNIGHGIGSSFAGTLAPFDGYLTEINFIDGQALTPSSFGETDALTGVWKPKKYVGTYGTNGFYLNFSDNSAATATTIGKDYSGNGNNWTPNNISVTAGPTYDSMLDVPTPWPDGGNGRGNYPILQNTAGLGNGTYSDANLGFVSGVSAAWKTAPSSMFQSSGKFYFEATITGFTSGNYVMPGVFGVQTNNTLPATYVGAIANGWGVQSTGAGQMTKYTNASGTVVNNASITSAVLNDVFQVAVDVDAGRIWFGKNNVWLEGSPSAGTTPSYTITPQPLAPAVSCYNNGGDELSANFGQRPFSYTPPAGFKALNTQNLPVPTIVEGNQYFDATLYTGNGTSQSIVNSGAMQPDLVWSKCRSAATTNNQLADAVRGANNLLFSNLTSAEAVGTGGITAFNTNGFSVNGNTNTNAATYVGWQWKESPTAGFDIVTYTGNGANRTIAHNLGVKPAMMIIKKRNASGTDWIVYAAVRGADRYLALNLTSAETLLSTVFNNTDPTSSVFTVGTASGVNTLNDTYVNYLFAEVEGFSRMRSYVGNGSADGPFVYCGFRPRFLLIKGNAAGAGWNLIDTSRSPYNVAINRLLAESANAEATDAAVDILSNGFKLRGTVANGSAVTYIFAAFAENPFKNALAR